MGLTGEISKKVLLLERDAKLLQKLRFIRNEILSNGAYHTKNLEIQINKLEAVNTPKEEIDLVTKSNEISSIISHNLMTKYNELIEEISTSYKKDGDSNTKQT